MALVTNEYYLSEYYGEPIATEDFPRYDARAEDAVLGYIMQTEEQVGFLPEDVQTLIKKAICAQIEYLWEYGITVASFGKEAGGGFTTGKVSVHAGSGSKVETGARSMIAPAVLVYLEQTGLLGRQVETVGMPPRTMWGWF